MRTRSNYGVTGVAVTLSASSTGGYFGSEDLRLAKINGVWPVGAVVVVGTQKAIFGYGYTNTNVSMTNLVSNTGVVSNDTTGVGTARHALAAAGYGTDKALINFYVEKGSPNSNNASLLIPTESLDVLLYDNIPFNKIIYSGIIVQNVGSGWKVYGNSQTKAYFTISKPKINGNYNLVTVEGESVQVAKDYFENTEILVPYGTEFVSKQDLAQFIASYGNYLATQGVLFDQIESGLDINWNQMVAEYLYWTQSGWSQGSLINLNPAANLITIQTLR